MPDMLNLEKSVSRISVFSAFLFPALLILRAADLISPGHTSLCGFFSYFCFSDFGCVTVYELGSSRRYNNKWSPVGGMKVEIMLQGTSCL